MLGIKSYRLKFGLLEGGLFDANWYQTQTGELKVDPLEHYLSIGWAEGRNPNPFFESQWYLLANLDVSNSGLNPLLHYLEYGEEEARWPCRIFDPVWYSRTYHVELGRGHALSHYLKLASRLDFRPNELFEPRTYLEINPDVSENQVDPALHYLLFGSQEGREISRSFSAGWYRAKYLSGDQSTDPVFHYLSVGRDQGFRSVPYVPPSLPPPLAKIEYNPTRKVSVGEQVRISTSPGPDFEEFDPTIMGARSARAKLIAFYLPQFHAIPENDRSWGKGFTEWRNTQRGVPRFEGHQQPRVPRDLGFYDLSNPDVLRQQIDLAKAAGIYGFCFYYYHFDGQRVLERPLNNFLSDPGLDFPFSIIWTNENWTRRWDGMDNEVLLYQHYNEKHETGLLKDWCRHFSDPRYIRVEGRPIFVIYRPGIIPDAAETIGRWRKRLQQEFDHDPWFLMVQGFGDVDPRTYGFDGAVEFPPHKLITAEIERLNPRLSVYEPERVGDVVSYDDVADASISEAYPDFPLIKTLVPSWDNDARRQGTGLILHGSTPKAYARWLEELVRRAVERPFHGEPLLFVNAWNEWAEAAYLEPDVYSGAAYLNTTARVLTDQQTSPAKPEVLLLGHDAHPHGAQMLLLHLGELFVRQFGLRVTFLLLEGGALLDRYREISQTIVASAGSPDLAREIENVRRRAYLAITNTVVTGAAVPVLKRNGFRVISLVHELGIFVRQRNLYDEARAIASQSDAVVCATEIVASEFKKYSEALDHAVKILPQGLYQRMQTLPDDRVLVRAELGLPENATIVLGIGFADLRKGIDLFLSTARNAAKRKDLYFLWVGHAANEVQTWLLGDPGKPPLPNFRHVDRTENPARYYSAADALFLSSREDPFPSTVLEALSCGLPIIGFEGCSGTCDLIRAHGELVPAFDIPAAVAAIERVLKEDRSDSGRIDARRLLIAEQYRFDRYGFRLLQMLEPRWRPISVVVPNYNYERYLEARMKTIFDQTEPVFEIIVLDDCSTDSSLECLERIRARGGRTFSIIPSSTNSGSIMKQWQLGAEHASGEFLWIAEADDQSDASFLTELLASARADDVLFAFCDSAQIDGEGRSLGQSYGFYYKLEGEDLCTKSFVMPAVAFAQKHLAVRNLILNVSSVLYRRGPLRQSLNAHLETLKTFSFAGDWFLYIALCLQGGRVAYVASSLNIHRRHAESAVHSTRREKHLEEIRRVHRVLDEAFSDAASARSRPKYIDELRKQFGIEDEEGDLAKAIPSAHGPVAGRDEIASATPRQHSAGARRGAG